MSLSSITVGWREWAVLPELGIPAVKVKVDTGARTSALHAIDIVREKVDGLDVVSFTVQPVQRNKTVTIRAQAPLVDIRSVSDSGGHTESRYVISSKLILGNLERDIDITLTERNSMLFRMLIGRTALAEGVVVDPAASFLCGRKSTRLIYSSNNETGS